MSDKRCFFGKRDERSETATVFCEWGKHSAEKSFNSKQITAKEAYQLDTLRSKVVEMRDEAAKFSRGCEKESRGRELWHNQAMVCQKILDMMDGKETDHE